MKQSMRYIMISLIAVFFIAGCSKQPLQEINDARSAVDSIMSDGAEKYLPEDAKKINDDLNKAMEEVRAQDAKIFKNFRKAKEMLSAVKTEAAAINSKLPAIKEEAKKGAIAAMEKAKTAIEATKALFEKTSRKKDLKASVETFRAEVKNLEDSFKELQAQVEREDYLTIASRAAEVGDKASELSALIKQKPAKTGKKKK
jgi:archaellum component FlaC